MIWLQIYCGGVVVGLLVAAWKRKAHWAMLAFFWPMAISFGLALLYFTGLSQLDKAGALIASPVLWKKAIGYAIIGLALLIFIGFAMRSE